MSAPPAPERAYPPAETQRQWPLVVGFALLLVVAAASIWFALASHTFNLSVAHTLQVRGTAYRMLTVVQDSETGERGYLLTGNPVYLKPYDAGRIEAPRAFADLSRLVADNPRQAESVHRLGRAIDAKMEDLALTTGLKKAGKGDEALTHVKLNIGNDLMQEVRVDIGAIEREEASRQDALSAAADLNTILLAIVTLVGIALVIGFAAYAIVLSRRQTRDLLAAQDGLRHTNENLEGLVADRVAELQLANEEIQRFAYIVSHDLRAPLVNVMGFTSELDAVRGDVAAFLADVEKTAPQLVTPDRRAVVETDLPEALGFIRTSTAKMDRLINAILKLSREGRRVLTPQPIDLRELLVAQGESLAQQLEAGEARLVVQDDLPDLVSDKLAVEQIFGNLIENAAKYLQRGRPGLIEVTGETQGAFRRYRIKDNGRGIDSKDFERVFELFRRSGEQNTPGEGIGLAYVRNLARRLGGNVTVQSEFGVGSTFTVALPATFNVKGKPTR